MARPRELVLAVIAGGCAAGVLLFGAGTSSAATSQSTMSVLEVLVEEEAVESASAAGQASAFASVADLDPDIVTLGDDARSPGQVVSDRVANDELLAALAEQQQAKRKALKALKPVLPNGSTNALAGVAPIPTAARTQKSAEIQRLIKKHFPASQLGNAMAVAACESGHSDAIGAVNNDGTRDWGAFQLNDGGTLQGALRAIGVDFESTEEAQQLALKTEINVRAAAKIYEARRWAPWVCAYKIGVVGSLYGNDPGPMNNKFDEWGKPTVPVPQVPVSAPDPEPTPTKTPRPSGDAKPTAEPAKSPKPSNPTSSTSPRQPSASPSSSTASPPVSSAPAPVSSGSSTGAAAPATQGAVGSQGRP